jgi:multiple sugar transport system substrate-binding protein
MKRLVLVLLVLAISVVSVSAGGNQENAPKATVTIAVPWAGAELTQFLPVLAAFEKKEGVKVKYVTYRGEDLSSILPAQFDAKQSLADIIFMWDWWVKKNSKYAEDLTDIWSAQKAAIIPPAIEADGKVVSVPYTMVAKPGFWYRKSFFQANGLKVPATWDEFNSLVAAIAKVKGVKNAIASGDGTGWPLSDVTEHFIVAFGGADMHRNLVAGTLAWTDPSVRKVFEQYLVPLLANKTFSDPIEWTQAIELWWSGEYGLYFMGNWLTGMVKDATDLGVFALPGTKALVTGPDTMFIPAVGDNKVLAKKLISFMLSKEGQTIRAQLGGKLIIRKDVPSSLYPKADQAVAEVVSKMETTLPDMDDTIGGDWQRLFWDQLKLLWVQPDSLNDVLTKLQANMPKK